MNDHSRLRWLCRRGVKELDIVLTSHLETQFPIAPASEQQAFRELLSFEDPHLFNLLLGSSHTTDSTQEVVLNQLRNTIKTRRAQ